MKRRAIRYYYFCYPHIAIKIANHLQNCSCRGCGNQRQYEGPPIRDLRRVHLPAFDWLDALD